jgi:uncharacterized membrane protein YbaN (DUF454 family)
VAARPSQRDDVPAPADPPEHDPVLETDAVVRNPLLRGVLLALGWISVGLGALGVVLPGWPTTVWLLIAAFFFARSSPRFYRWLLTHRVFGPIVRDIRAGLGLPLRAKVFAISMIVLFAGGSAVFLGLARPWLGVLVAAVGAVGIAYIVRMPTRPARG